MVDAVILFTGGIKKMITTIVTALAAGVTYALSGYGKAVGEKFDLPKFATTTLIGLVVGIIMIIIDVNESIAFQYASTIGITTMIQNIIGTINKRVL